MATWGVGGVSGYCSDEIGVHRKGCGLFGITVNEAVMSSMGLVKAEIVRNLAGQPIRFAAMSGV
nr:hypothetical protein [Tanacetum cinerariifolium]